MTDSIEDDLAHTEMISEALRSPLDRLPLVWVIYRKGTDNEANLYTARAWQIAFPAPIRPLEYVIRSPEIDELREQFREAGRTIIPRDPGDAPEIVESWW